MTQPHPQPTEYIITMARIIKARNMLMVDGYKNADVLDRMVNLLRSRPHTPAAPATEYTIEQIAEIDNRIRKERKAEREKVLLKYQNWVAKEAKMALNGETRALVVRLNSKLIKEIESLRGGGAP